MIFYEPLYVSNGGIDNILVRVKNESLFVLNTTYENPSRMLALQKKDSVPKNYQMISVIPK